MEESSNTPGCASSRPKRKHDAEDEAEGGKRTRNEDECLSLIDRRGNGEVYDFIRTDHRNEVMRKLVDCNPKFLIADGFHEKMRKQNVTGDVEERCKKHLDFLGHLYEWQETRGRYFVHMLREGERRRFGLKG